MPEAPIPRSLKAKWSRGLCEPPGTKGSIGCVVLEPSGLLVPQSLVLIFQKDGEKGKESSSVQCGWETVCISVPAIDHQLAHSSWLPRHLDSESHLCYDFQFLAVSWIQMIPCLLIAFFSDSQPSDYNDSGCSVNLYFCFPSFTPHPFQVSGDEIKSV